MNIFEKQFDTNLIEEGVWFRPNYPNGPRDGEPMDGDNGQPVRIRVRSVDSTTYRDYLNRRSRRNVSHMVGAKSRRAEKELVKDTTKDDRAEQFAVLVTGFENIDAAGQKTVPSENDLLAFVADFDKDKGWIVRPGIVWLVDDVIKFANDSMNYGAPASTEGNDPKPTPSTES